MTTTRNWIFGAFGAAVATAAVITGVVLAGNNNQSADDQGPAGTPSPSADATDLPTDDPTDPPTTGGSETKAVAVYYVGATPQGPRLYREFHAIAIEPGMGLLAGTSVKEALRVQPDDPDYRTLWPAGTDLASIETGSDFTTLSLRNNEGTNLHDRPAGMSEAEAGMAVEQLIYTIQAELGNRLPVQFMLDDQRTDQILGQPASEPLANGPVLDTLAHVNITTPEQDEVVTGDTLEVTGVANSFEANVLVKLQRYEGTAIAFQEGVMADGYMGPKLFPFAHTFDISDVEPGKYILSATTDDPSGGVEGNGPHTDSKIITIQ